MSGMFAGAGVSPEKIAMDSMERYCGSNISEFQPYLLITNFPKYVEYFAASRRLKVIEGTTFKVAHSPSDNMSILDFKMGSPMAALIIDLCAFLPIKAILMLGMAGGLRDHYRIGDFFIPVGSIRADGTSDFYFPPEVPALANFIVQRIVTEVLEDKNIKYHLGITHTTNRRFWEFNEEFKEHILATRPQAIEMECATLFVASYKHKVPLGALLLISDLPLTPNGIKTKKSSDHVFEKFTADHVETGILVLKRVQQKQKENDPRTHGLLIKHVKSVSTLKKTAKKEILSKKMASSAPILKKKTAKSVVKEKKASVKDKTDHKKVTTMKKKSSNNRT